MSGPAPTVGVTLAIRTRNAGRWLSELLPRLTEQERKPDEFLVVDSGSTDGTVERMMSAGLSITAPGSALPAGERARVVTIPGHEFSHARSTNLAFREARGEVVAMISQDALPADAAWLARLLAPLESADEAPSPVAAVFGRHLARPGAFPLERWQIEIDYPASGSAGVLFSNVNSAARRSAWQDEPFDESLAIAEDRVWAARQGARGRRIVYAPGAAVIHSHEYTLREAMERCRAESGARREAEGHIETASLLYKAWPRQTWHDLLRLAREGRATAWPRAAIYRLAQFYGMWRGGRDGPATRAKAGT
jgi:rhamnosyltransferase